MFTLKIIILKSKIEFKGLDLDSKFKGNSQIKDFSPVLRTFVEFAASACCTQLDYPKVLAQLIAFKCKLQLLSHAGLEPKF